MTVAVFIVLWKLFEHFIKNYILRKQLQLNLCFVFEPKGKKEEQYWQKQATYKFSELTSARKKCVLFDIVDRIWNLGQKTQN